MKFERTAGNVEPVIKNVVEDELKGEDVKVDGELVEVGKAVELASKRINLVNWVKPHSSLSFQFEAVQLVLQLAKLPTFFCLLGDVSLWPELLSEVFFTFNFTSREKPTRSSTDNKQITREQFVQQ